MRCPHCERLLDTPALLRAGECGCRWQHRDVVMGRNGNFFVGERDRYSGRIEWFALLEIGHSQPNPPEGAVLIRRHFEGKPLPVVDLATGDLFAVDEAS